MRVLYTSGFPLGSYALLQGFLLPDMMQVLSRLDYRKMLGIRGAVLSRRYISNLDFAWGKNTGAVFTQIER